MTNKMREEIYRLYRDLYKYVRNNPGVEGMELVYRYEELLCNNDLLIGSKKTLKDKIMVNTLHGDTNTVFYVNLTAYKTIRNSDFIVGVADEETVKNITKEEFINSLEDDWLNEML